MTEIKCVPRTIYGDFDLSRRDHKVIVHCSYDIWK
jgi:hypothetical protein